MLQSFAYILKRRTATAAPNMLAERGEKKGAGKTKILSPPLTPSIVWGRNEEGDGAAARREEGRIKMVGRTRNARNQGPRRAFKPADTVHWNSFSFCVTAIDRGLLLFSLYCRCLSLYCIVSSLGDSLIT